jgi:hypothetical protein
MSAEVDPEFVKDWALVLNDLPRNIHSADEIGVCYNLLRNRMLAAKDGLCCGGRRSKEQFTVLTF